MTKTPQPSLHYIVSFRWKRPGVQVPRVLLDWKTPEADTCHSMNDVFALISEYGEERGEDIRVICANLQDGAAADVTANALLELSRSFVDDGEPCPWWLVDYADVAVQHWADRVYQSQVYDPASVAL